MSFVSGGYYLIRPASRAEHMDPRLLPERILTVSDCITNLAPGTWAIEWANDTRKSRLKDAAKFGIDEAGLAEITQWTTKALENGTLGWPHVFFDLGIVREFAIKFLGQCSDVQVLGLALHHDECSVFLEEAAPGKGEGEVGVYTCINAGRELEVGGTAAGFDVLGLDFQSFHSYICNGLEVEFDQKLRIKPNTLGFFDRHADAIKCAEHSGLDSTAAEPALWQPWKVVLYDC